MIRKKSNFSRFLKPYYIVNILILFAYPTTRLLLKWGGKAYDIFGYNREDSVLFLLGIILFVKYRKSCTMEHFLSEIFWLGKLSEITLYFFVDFKIFLYYLFACTGIIQSLLVFMLNPCLAFIASYLMFRMPLYDGPSNMIRIRNEDQFDSLIIRNCEYNPKKRKNDEEDSDNESDNEGKSKNQKQTKKNKQIPPHFQKIDEKPKLLEEKNMWLVEFYANWAETCVYTKSIWADYSLKYQTSKLRFAEVDVANLKELAEIYKINTSIMSRQLPTLILFEDGVEVLRFPPILAETGRVGRVLKYHKGEIAKFFDLDKRWLATRLL